MESLAIYMPIILALIGLAYMLYKKSWVMKQDAGDGKMKEISDHIYEGALAFLNAEYKLISSICSCCQFSFSWCFSYSSNYALAYSYCFYFWSFFLCMGWKYGNENCNKN